REQDLPARLGRLARPHVRERARGVEDALDEDLHFTARILPPPQPRLDHLRVVEDEDVLRIDERYEIAERAILHAAGAPIQMQEPARGALGGRMLRDEIGGKV